jgi:hypothetical protein
MKIRILSSSQMITLNVQENVIIQTDQNIKLSSSPMITLMSSYSLITTSVLLSSQMVAPNEKENVTIEPDDNINVIITQLPVIFRFKATGDILSYLIVPFLM